MKKILQNARNLIVFIDLFGHSPSFVINGRLLHKTFFGGTLTIIVVIVAVISTIFFSQELLFRKSPSVNLSTQSDLNPKKINYFNNFEFAIGLQNSNYLPEINEKIYYAKGFIFKTIVNSSGSFNIRENLNVERCSESLIKNNNYDLFKQLNLENFYCISLNQDEVNNDDIYLEEFWGHHNFRMLQIKFYDCVNSTNNNDCASQETIDSFLNLSTLSYYIIDNYVRTNNYKNPFQRALKEYFFYVSNKFLLSLTQYFHHSEIYTDDGFIFTTNNQISSFKIDSMVENTIFNRSDKHFVSISFQLNNNIEQFQRKYYKVQDLAAQVGGIYNTLFLICLLFLKLYEDNSYFQYLINKFFEVRFEDIHNKKNNQRVTKRKKTFSRAIVQKEFRNISYENNNEQTKRKNEHGLEICFLDKLIFLNFCKKFSKSKKRKTDKIFLKGRKYIMNYLNITTYLKNTHSEEIKSYLILDESQKKIFDYVFKPIISYSFLGTRYNINELPFGIKDRLIGHQKNDAEQIIKKANEKIPSSEKKKLKNVITEAESSNREQLSSENDNEISSESKY